MFRISIVKNIFINMCVIVLMMIVMLGIQYQQQRLESAESAFRAQMQQFTFVRKSVQKISDDLTSMARLYVLTGEEKYKEFYYKIAQIRDGEINFPKHYHSYLSELEARSAKDVIETENYTIGDYYQSLNSALGDNSKIQSAKFASAELTQLELQAFSLFEKGDQQQAIDQLTGINYSIMKRRLSNYTSGSKDIMEKAFSSFVDYKETQQHWLRVLTVIMITSAMLFVVIYNKKIRYIISSPVKSLESWGQKLAHGNYREELKTEVPIEFRDLKSTMGILADNTDKLVTRLNELATVDELTGLPNRRAITEYTRSKQEEVTRYGVDCSMLIFDIDFFKKVNDTYGHPVGDKVLSELSDVVSRKIRGSDFFARIGGEEFIIVMPNCDLNAACVLAEKIRNAVQQHVFKCLPADASITISCGVASLIGGREVKTSYKEADDALYQSKGLGRNQVQRFAY